MSHHEACLVLFIIRQKALTFSMHDMNYEALFGVLAIVTTNNNNSNSATGCIWIMGLVCQLPQHNFTANSRKCSWTCRSNHFCFQEQSGMNLKNELYKNQPQLYDKVTKSNQFAWLQDISLGVALGSATQISLFVVRNHLHEVLN